MSGGVDSSVAAALLKQQGYRVIGVLMKFWKGSGETENRCCSSESEIRAREVAKILDIPFYLFNFEKEFKKRVVNYFLKEYKIGLTPNPCVVCNKEIKFGLLLEKALSLKADYIATGHYARISSLKLLRAKDKQKDQSYFLWKLNQRQLKHILFPIGDYTRREVEKMAEKFKLPFQGVKKSQEICFVPEKIENFLENHLRTKHGKIVDISGRVLGQHQGLWFYTIGQRKGIGLAGGPYWVLGNNLRKNTLIVTNNQENLYQKELILRKISWISGKEPKLPLRIMAQIRYQHKPVSAVITKALKPLSYSLKLNKAERAITPGQSVVFYSPQKQELLGGAIIC